jgi:ABC-2 type transport system permease protein
MLGPLLNKDLRRAVRNPVPFLIHLALPLVITALIGLTFGGGSSRGNKLGRIQMAIVDEDQSPLTDFLRGALSQRQAGEYFDVKILSREEAVIQITDNKLSAVWIIPEGFTSAYLNGETGIAFELIKNPAQTYYPAIVEEMLSLVTTALNALGRGLRSELPAWQRLLEEEDFDLLKVAGILQDAGDRLDAVRPYVYPPLLQYAKETEPSGEASLESEESSGRVGAAPFAFLLAGLGAVFLLFTADIVSRDLFVEVQLHTIERFHTYSEGLMVFVVSKAFFSVVVLLIAAAIIFGGGALLFQFSWQQPMALIILIFAYACAAAGLMATISALAGNARRADLFNTIFALGLGLAGGCMVPPQQLPTFVRETISPWLPTYWFADALRTLQYDAANASWLPTALLLSALGLAGLAVSAFIFRRRLEQGVKS